MSRPVHSSSVSRHRALMIVASSLVGIVAFALFAIALQAPTKAPAAQVPHFVEVAPSTSAPDSTLRTLFIGAKDAQLPISGTGGLLIASLVSGQVPVGATSAVVQTDSNCQPDKNGISHCFNELSFDGVRVVVQHHHNMSDTPCLTPGETVNLAKVL